MYMCDSTCVCIYHGFSQFLFVWFVYLCALSLFVCHFCLPDCCLKKQKNRPGIGRVERWWRSKRRWERGNHHQNILYKISFYYFLKTRIEIKNIYNLNIKLHEVNFRLFIFIGKWYSELFVYNSTLFFYGIK